VSGPIERIHWELQHALPPDEVLAALVDFSERRSSIWIETSHPAVYRVHAVGPDWADVTEGIPSAWSRERYDWSTPDLVTLSQLAGNLVDSMGSIRYRITALDDGGSRITCDRERHYRGDMNSRLRGTLMQLAGGPILRRQFRLGLDRWEKPLRSGG
jgi:hypothetical protein